DCARPPRPWTCNSLLQEGLCRLNCAFVAQKRVNRSTVPVHSPIHVMRPAANGHGGLVHSPGGPNWPGKSCPPLLILWDIPMHPPHDRRMRHGDAALGHHGDQVAVAEPVRDVPADALFDHFDGVAPPAVHGVAWNSTRHSGPHFEGRQATVSATSPLMHQNPRSPPSGLPMRSRSSAAPARRASARPSAAQTALPLEPMSEELG